MTNGSKGSGYWADFPVTYRTEEIATIVRWIAAGESGVVVGSSGTGKSNLAGFLSSRIETIEPYVSDNLDQYCFLHLDINSLPALTVPFFYRGLIQTLHNASLEIGPEAQQTMQQLTKRQSVEWNDIFEVLTVLQQAHQYVIYQAGKKVVWLLDRFDEACQRLDAQTLNSLRSLRDQFKGQLCYVLFTRHPLARLRDLREIDEFYEIVAANTCWVGPMVDRDARWIAHQMAERLRTTFSESEILRLIQVTGRLPAFMKLGCLALAEGAVKKNDSTQTWVEQLLGRTEFQRNCQEIWGDLSTREQAILLALSRGARANQLDQETLSYLETIGLLIRTGPQDRLRIFSPILAAFIAQQGQQGERGLELDREAGAIRRDGIALEVELTPYESGLLTYLLENAGKICEKDSLIAAIWPDEYTEEGISDERLAQLIARLRRKVEPDPSHPTYIQTVRGRGYRFVQPGE